MRINIGGGFKRYEGFINLDFDKETNPDFVVNLESDTLPFPDNSITEIKAHHILEHIGSGFFHLMQELYRVADDGCLFDIQVPHHRSEVFYGDCSHVRPITIDNLRQFDKAYNDWHISQWNSSSGFGNRLKINWKILEFNLIPDSPWDKRFPEMSQEEIQEVSKNFNNVYSETHIKLVAVKKGFSWN